MANGTGKLGATLLGGLAARLRFPQLFLLTAALFLLDLLVPDLLPFVDEVLLGLATMLLGSWKAKKGRGEEEEKPPMKDVTPTQPARRDAEDG
ncbi:MAG: DUF6116 family protein [Thermoanaerobaculia bacterium]|nr:DUF6116 family protein [Thermoanaerobaculia bacterium]